MDHPRLDPKTSRVRPEDLHVTNDEPADSTYEPSEIEATRAREQGVGLGARDIARQRDPHGAPAAGQGDEEVERIEPEDPRWT